MTATQSSEAADASGKGARGVDVNGHGPKRENGSREGSFSWSESADASGKGARGVDVNGHGPKRENGSREGSFSWSESGEPRSDSIGSQTAARGYRKVSSTEHDAPTVAAASGGWWTRVSPWTIGLLFALVASDACTLMVIGPFLPAFVQQRLGVQPSAVGLSVGLITGAYNLGNGLFAPHFGNLSDKHGRRPFLLLGVMASAVFTLLFPFQRRVWSASACRLLTGSLNSGSALTKAYLADMTTRERGALPADRALLFAYLGAVWALARSLGSAASGLFTGLSIRWLAVDGAANPYLAPCILMVLYLSAVLAVATRFLPESRTPSAARGGGGRADVASLGFVARSRWVFQAGGTTMQRLLVCNSVHQFCNGGLLIALVLFTALERARGGMGLGPNAVGVVFTHFGVVGLLFQALACGTLLRRLGLRRMYMLGVSLLAVGCFIMPLAAPMSRLAEGWDAGTIATTASASAASAAIHERLQEMVSWASLALVWVPLTVMLLPIACGFMAGLPILFSLISNASPLEVQGLAQGLAQSSGGVFRTFGPLVTGVVFGMSVAHAHIWITFAMLAVLYGVCALLVVGLREEAEKSYEEQHEGAGPERASVSRLVM